MRFIPFVFISVAIIGGGAFPNFVTKATAEPVQMIMHCEPVAVVAALMAAKNAIPDEADEDAVGNFWTAFRNKEGEWWRIVIPKGGENACLLGRSKTTPILKEF